MVETRTHLKTFDPDESRSWHAHRGAAITLVLDGALQETFEDCDQRCPAWSVHYKPAGAPHVSAGGERGVTMYVVELLGDAAPVRPPTLLGCGATTAVALRAMVTRSRDAVDRLVSMVANRIRDGHDDRAPDWLLDARERIRRFEVTSPVASTLAGMYGVHRVHLARAFRRHFGASIVEHVRRARTDAAARLLAGSNVTLATLALDLGYHDQSHFTNDFRRVTGLAPGRFRRLVADLQDTATPTS